MEAFGIDMDELLGREPLTLTDDQIVNHLSSIRMLIDRLEDRRNEFEGVLTARSVARQQEQEAPRLPSPRRRSPSPPPPPRLVPIPRLRNMSPVPEAGPSVERPADTLQQLIEAIDNPHQRFALSKITGGPTEAQMYLMGYAPNESRDRRHAHVEGAFTILGTVRNGAREQYEVKMFRQGLNPRGSFWCNCPDHKFNSTKRNMVCKHVCFLVCRLAGILSPSFFETKQLTPEQHAMLLERVANSTVLQARPVPPSALAQARDAAAEPVVLDFRARTRPLAEDDECPICCELLEGHSLLSCVDCHNYVHEGCMRVWLERHHTCVYCRSDAWARFR